MNTKKKKLDLLELSNIKRIQLINGFKGKLRQKIMEAKLWQSLLEAETLTINEEVIFCEQELLM